MAHSLPSSALPAGATGRDAVRAPEVLVATAISSLAVIIIGRGAGVT